MADSKASLSIDGKVVAELPILSGSAGNDVIDIRTLGAAGLAAFVANRRRKKKKG